MSRRVLLAVDLSYQVYRQSAAHPDLWSGTTFTGGLYGFLVSVARAILDVKATHLVLCQDRKPYRRSEQYPLYKSFRTKAMDEDLVKAGAATMSLVLDLADVLGLPVWGVDGFEADDMPAHVVNKYRHRWDRIVSMSNDSDLFQLFWCPRFSIYVNPEKPCQDVVWLKENLKMTPQEFRLANAIMGTHNDVQGVRGIGPVKALQILREPDKFRAFREKHGELMDRNLELITLPHPEFPYDERFPEVGPRPSPHRALYKFCGRYDITVTNAMQTAFEQVHRL